ncbi:TetR/AcrR family transcriptional regulator [Nocardioides sp. KR10-350]|uniref:TetR/AcrR family transcriptional regulator n=1 Tax=Nocardioides cheoyonin TaxID=3156615 RepID=UPI0032B45807
MAHTSGPGRRRSEASRRAILAAATRILAADGAAGLSMERIAREAGVGKQTIYRWWPGKVDVLMEALLEQVHVQVPVPDTGSLEGDLREFLIASRRAGRLPRVADLLRALAAEAQVDEAYADRFREVFVSDRRSALGAILERYPDQRVDVRVDTLLDVVFGVIWYRLLIVPGAFDERTVDELVRLIVRDARVLRTARPAR